MRFQLLNPQVGWTRPWIAIPIFLAPLLGASFLWFSGDSVDKTSPHIYWTFWLAIQILWGAIGLSIRDNMYHQQANYAVVDSRTLSVTLMGMQQGFPLESIDFVYKVEGSQSSELSVTFEKVLIELTAPVWWQLPWEAATTPFKSKGIILWIADADKFVALLERWPLAQLASES